MTLAPTDGTMLGPDQLQRDVPTCPRCERPHRDVRFERMENPITLRPTEDPDLSFVYEWAGQCPVRGTPILGRKLEEQGE